MRRLGRLVWVKRRLGRLISLRLYRKRYGHAGESEAEGVI